MRLTRSGLASMLACAALSGAWTVQNQPVGDWIRAHAIRLTTPEAGHGFADLQPLKPVIGNARIVSLGEATHGTREFFQLKHRMLEFLATEMGFTIFSIEANMPEAYRLNDYVLNGTGDPAAAPARHVLLDVGHRRSAGHDPVDARVQPVGQGARGVHRLRHADARRRAGHRARVRREVRRAVPSRRSTAGVDAGDARPPRRRRRRASAWPPVRFRWTRGWQEEFATAATSRPRA